MFRRVFLAALAAGLLAGLAISLLQQVTTTPLILHAETFETGGLVNDHGVSAGTAAHSQDGEAWAPADGIERILFTTLANMLTGVGFALVLTACFVLRGEAVDGRRGLLWGVAGFACATLAPALGLAPEVPGSAAADLTARQLWWLAAVVAAGVGLWFLVFSERVWMRMAGVAVMAVPHFVGAPHPEVMDGAAPAELAARFAATSIVVSAVFWALIGWLSGTFFDRLGRAA